MTRGEDGILQQLDAKVRLLIQQHGALLEERARLKAAIAEKDAQLEKLQGAYDKLHAEYDNLKTARLISVSGGDVEMAKAKLSRLSRDISKCIAMMSVQTT